jgi:GT2 family glycosyltransferase
MQGAILMPLEAKQDPAFLQAYHRYRTIDFIDYGPGMKEIRTLTGANMAMRREVFARVGLFNEQLGPGRSGISEDVEFAQRLLRSGGRIGYEPRAAVYHAADRSRLTEVFFRIRHEQQGRSRLLYKKQSIASILSNLIRSVLGFGWYSAVGNERKKYRAKGRYYHYRAMLEEKCKKITGAPI